MDYLINATSRQLCRLLPPQTEPRLALKQVIVLILCLVGSGTIVAAEQRDIVIPLHDEIVMNSVFKGEWTLYVDYSASDIVSLSGSSYIAIQTHSSDSTNSPSNDSFWSLLVNAEDSDLKESIASDDKQYIIEEQIKPTTSGSENRSKQIFLNSSNYDQIIISEGDLITVKGTINLTEQYQGFISRFLRIRGGSFNSSSGQRIDFGQGSIVSDASFSGVNINASDTEFINCSFNSGTSFTAGSTMLFSNSYLNNASLPSGARLSRELSSDSKKQTESAPAQSNNNVTEQQRSVSDHVISDDEWLFSLADKPYTLQLASFFDDSSLTRFLKQSKLKDRKNIKLFTSISNGIEWRYVLYNSYPTIAAAENEKTIKKFNNAWIRNIDQIRKKRCKAWQTTKPASPALKIYCQK